MRILYYRIIRPKRVKVGLRDGRLVETGSHESLYKLNGEYRKIFDASARSLNLDKMMDTIAG